MLDDNDNFHDRETNYVLNFTHDFAPKWMTVLFLIFNLLGARGIYFNLRVFDFWGVLISSGLWGITLAVLVHHNYWHKRRDKALRM